MAGSQKHYKNLNQKPMRAFKISPPTLSNYSLSGHRVLLEQVESITEQDVLTGHAFIIHALGPQVPEEAGLKGGNVCLAAP